MNDYLISVNERRVSDAYRAANLSLHSVQEFANVYNELRKQASAMEETSEDMPALITESLHAMLKNPDSIKDLYFKTIAVPEMAGGFKVKLETLDIKHPDYQLAINYARATMQNIHKQQYADLSAYAVREGGTKVIISDKWKESVMERNTEKATTPVDKKVYDALKQIIAIREEVKKTTGIEINLERIAPALGGNVRPFKDIFHSSLPYPRRSELIEETEEQVV
ncbi:hypothetical protein WJR50_32995 [Catalinimonas sp. 4WD22]|uniref:hypothetical protein n=1 Tax=Catalinimonas locisalis TaxID=3133978 RepID=UPI003100ABB2